MKIPPRPIAVILLTILGTFSRRHKLVQVYDIKNNSWQQASPFLGQPVFGHAAGISDNIMLVCDGVAVVPHLNKRRSYQSTPQCRLRCRQGIINPEQPLKINWSIVKHPTGQARYRISSN